MVSPGLAPVAAMRQASEAEQMVPVGIILAKAIQLTLARFIVLGGCLLALGLHQQSLIVVFPGNEKSPGAEAPGHTFSYGYWSDH